MRFARLVHRELPFNCIKKRRHSQRLLALYQGALRCRLLSDNAFHSHFHDTFASTLLLASAHHVLWSGGSLSAAGTEVAMSYSYRLAVEEDLSSLEDVETSADLSFLSTPHSYIVLQNEEEGDPSNSNEGGGCTYSMLLSEAVRCRNVIACVFGDENDGACSRKGMVVGFVAMRYLSIPIDSHINDCDKQGMFAASLQPTVVSYLLRHIFVLYYH